jgi:hypothetical protein
MPNILLLIGIVAYALAHLPHPRALNDRNRRYRIKMTTACVGLGILILAQGIFSTPFGVRRARVFRELHVQDGRTAVNLDRIPLRQQGCYARDYVWNHLYRPSLALSRLHHYRSSALRDHLIVFAPGTYRKFRAQGPPDPPRQCLRRFGAN